MKAAKTVALVLPLVATGALADDQYVLNQNQTGFSLPGVTQPGGHDEVRASDGTVCRSAVGGRGAYLDLGVVGNQRGGSIDDGAVYGRVVVPLGRRHKRLDCARLYELEVERLELELRLLRAGLGRGGGSAGIAQGDADDWARTEFSGSAGKPVPRSR